MGRAGVEPTKLEPWILLTAVLPPRWLWDLNPYHLLKKKNNSNDFINILILIKIYYILKTIISIINYIKYIYMFN